MIPLAGHESVLDLGCGDGRTTLRLAECVPNGTVLGIDASNGMISAARDRETPNCSFRLMDMRELPYENIFDVVFSDAALHWVTDQSALAHDSCRALKPGGLFAAEFAAAENCPEFTNAVRETMCEKQYEEAFAGFVWPWAMPSRTEFAGRLRDAGFVSADVQEVSREQVFADADALAAWIDQPCIVPFLEYLKPSLREAFRRQVIARSLARMQQTDGTCLEHFRRLRVFARKDAKEA